MAFNQLKTVWGENISDKPLQEYPRPQMARNSYINLNGWWDYAFSQNEELPFRYDGKILVPFSPESTLSGVEKRLLPKQFLFYRTYFTLPKTFVKDIVLLNFGAVDCVCDVFVNGDRVAHHEGGYTSFSADITQSLVDENNELIVRVSDKTNGNYSRGKQSLRRGGMWYTPQSGIWQTVWLESVPSEYIKGLRITPVYDEARVVVEADCSFNEPITVIVYNGENEIAKADGTGVVSVSFPYGQFLSWSPESPFLYKMTVISRRDKVQSYFAMRKFSVQTVGGHARLMLNNLPYFHNGLLDQGYWSDGLYTAPSDEALVYDISTAKKMGYNMLRKHAKVETARWYYHCDRLGMLVWQDMPSGGAKQKLWYTLLLPNIGKTNCKDTHYGHFSRAKKQSRDWFYTEYSQVVAQLYNCPCIAMWVPFNEGWGQFDAKKIYNYTKQLDPTRTVDHASGWHDQGVGDIKSMHVYFRPVELHKDKLRRPLCLTEFGGYSLPIEEHRFNTNKVYGYKKLTSSDELNREIAELYRRDVIRLIPQGLSAAVLTQLSDVEDEVNGLVTFDRKQIKVDEQMMRDINKQVKYYRDWTC